jgi:glutathione peroxidase
MRLLQVLSVCVLFGAIPAMIHAQEKKKSIYDFQVTTIDGQKIDLAKYKGKVIVIVNVASECGYTGQYKGLQELHAKYGKDGLAILAFPCNDFGKQEPDNEAKIKDFAKKNYGVQFDLFSKVKILGKDAAPLYKFLTSKETNPTKPGDVKWNFEKFIFGRDGAIVARFLSDVEPDSKDFTDALKKQLATK